jgi:POT family proton-dependent oligopeptide transporter
MTALGAAAAQEQRQPRGLYLLFGVEMWERFSYYGMRAFLVLFLTASIDAGGYGWDKGRASHLYGWYTGLVYLTPLLGGFLADRVLGTHIAIVIGSIVIAAGHFCLAVPLHVTFFSGLALIVIGTGFHKSNISTMVGQLFKPGDPRRDGAFTIFYVGINTGAILGPAVCDTLAESPSFGWHYGFGAAGVGMVAGLALYLSFKRRLLGDIGNVAPARQGVGGHTVADEPLSREAKERIAAIAVLAFFNVFFWTAFEQAGSSMNFFAKERTDRVIFGSEVPVGWFQMVNPMAIVLFGPLFARMWTALGARGREPSTPMKFATALFLVSLGFAVMTFAAHFSDAGAKVGPGWLVAAYLLHTWGELCLSPVGLSMVTKLAPAKFSSLMMGVWFLSNFVSDLVAGLVAGTVEKVEKGQLYRLLGGQADFYLMFVVAPAAAGVLVLLLSSNISKLMHERA